MSYRLDQERKSIVVAVPGDLLSTVADSIKRQMLEAIDPAELPPAQWECLEADLRGATMIDSVGLNLLVSVIKELGKQGKRMRILVAAPHVMRALRFTRLDQLAEVVRIDAGACGDGKSPTAVCR